MKEVLDQYTKFLWERFQSDMDVFGNPWMYIPLLIPFIFYMIFFVLKWYILLFPITLPISVLKGIFKIPVKHDIENVMSGFTSNDIFDEMDADMEDSGMSQGEIESCINHWRNKYYIIRRKKN